MIVKSSRGDYSVSFIEDAGELNKLILPSDFIIIDSNVNKSGIIDLSNNGHYIVESSEDAKSFDSLGPVLSAVQSGMQKNDRIVCVGGGIVQDIAGFVSSILFRGVEWVFIPTTLLAQADSCIGGKTSINLGGFKNQLGNFFPPSNIYICTKFLETLPEEDIVSGIGECLHYLLIDGYSSSYRIIPTLDPWGKVPEQVDYLDLIRTCLSIKTKFIEIDEFDKNERLVLNYGHTFGHALEACMDISHGRAVAFGMVFANKLSELTGLAPHGNFDRFNNILGNYFDVDSIDLEEFLGALRLDKKNVDDNLTCILSSDIGDMKKVTVDYKLIEPVLDQMGMLVKPEEDSEWTQ